MRTNVCVVAGVLLLASAMPVRGQVSSEAQQPPPLQQPAAPAAAGKTPWIGSIDLGFGGSEVNGDAARYERYRDLQNGAFGMLGLSKKTSSSVINATAFNIGREDQRYRASFSGSRVRFDGGFVSVPLNFGYNTASPWMEKSPNVFTLDPLARQQVQAKTILGVPASPADLQKTSIYRVIAPSAELQQLRQAGRFGMTVDVNERAAVDASFTTTRKTGVQPWGASFAFNNANELPMRLDNRTHDATAGLEYAQEKGMVRVGWNGSWFDNDVKELVWDNPIRMTDTNPYDPSGYSNGNGSAQGRMSAPPSNWLNAVSAVALYKMPKRTTLNGTLTFTQMNQNDPLIPWTINPVLQTPAVLHDFPGLASLPRATAEAKVDGVNGVLNLTSRPSRRVGFNVRYRYNDHVNKTPHFDAVEYVRFDAVPEETGSETEQFNITQNTVDASMTLQVAPFTSLKLGYGYDSFDRTGRAFSDMTDQAFRASLDTVGNQWVTVRAMYEHVARVGSGFSEASIEEGGSQPGLRFYDEADRDRDRGTLLFIVNPVDVVGVTFSLTAGRDIYNGAGHEFGLMDNDNTAFNVMVDVTPGGPASFGASYGRDKYNANQLSRNANPPPDPQFNDPLRNWTLNNVEHVNNVNVFMDVDKAFGDRTSLRVAYDFSDSDNAFNFGGPRITSLTAANTFIPLPNVTNAWHRLTADVSYYFQKQVGVAVGYWYEKYDVTDFATVDLPNLAGTPRIDYLGEISTGYGNRPYKGNTAFVRLLYRF